MPEMKNPPRLLAFEALHAAAAASDISMATREMVWRKFCDAMVDEFPLLAALVRQQHEALSAANGYLLNAKIDLETGATKRTAISTIEGGLKVVDTALAAGHKLIGDEQEAQT